MEPKLPVPPDEKRRRRNLVLGLALGLPLALCLLLGGFVALMLGTAKPQPVTANDKAALLTAGDLLASGGSDAAVDEAAEVFKRERFFDGSSEVTYEFSQETPAMYVSTTLSLERNTQDAMTTYLSYRTAGPLGLRIYGGGSVKLEARPGLFAWGDQSTAMLMTVEGTSVGNFVVARKGTRVFLTTFTGVYFDDAQALREVLGPKLEALEKLEP